jgi:hypothetical protein
VMTFDMGLEDSDDELVLVRRRLRRTNKTRKQANSVRDVALEKLMQMQEELSKMIAAHQTKI